jgi:uncharacterized repeat protein (TIGR03803 family)
MAFTTFRGQFAGAALAVCLLVSSSALGVSHETVLHGFHPVGTDGVYGASRLTFDAAGNAYGTTYFGGTYNHGAIFELIPVQGGGWSEKILYSFTNGADGSLNYACSASYYCNEGLIFDASGNLYGATSGGGPSGNGVVFELSPTQNGEWTLTVLYTFTGFLDGGVPNGDLVFDTAGNLYGTTAAGGSHGYGTVFSLTRTQGGWTQSVLYTFTGGFDGDTPVAGLTIDFAGNLYGTASGMYGYGGGYGSVFKLAHTAFGWSFLPLYSFHGNDGYNPEAKLVFGPDGALYSTTLSGGNGNGVVFRLTPPPTFCAISFCPWIATVIHTFNGGTTDGSTPVSEVVFDQAGNLYGTTDHGGAYGWGLAYRLTRNQGGSWTESVLHNFKQDGTDGIYPDAGLVFSSDGKLYGTTLDGGNYGDGIVFSLARDGGDNWTEAVLHNHLYDGTDGARPEAKVVFDSAGNLFGTTVTGGTYDHGAVFELSPAQGGGWNEQLLYSFRSIDGCGPRSTLIMDSAGNLYGTSFSCGANSYGAVFKLSPTLGGSWTETVLYNFRADDGQYPCTGLISDATGNLYGTTAFGGTYGVGTVYELTPTQGGYTERVLYSFDGPHGDNSFCLSGSNELTLDAAGNLYGTTPTGGDNHEGAAYRLSPSQGGDWTQTELYSFAGADGALPYSSLISDLAGNVYGTTLSGGANNLGTVFELTSNQSGGWTETVLYSFAASPDGARPRSGVVFDSVGNLYGTTATGGDHTAGTTFKLTSTHGGGWTENVLYSFDPGAGDGNTPRAGLVIDAAGNLYGTTSDTLRQVYAGTVFQITP